MAVNPPWSASWADGLWFEATGGGLAPAAWTELARLTPKQGRRHRRIREGQRFPRCSKPDYATRRQQRAFGESSQKSCGKLGWEEGVQCFIPRKTDAGSSSLAGCSSRLLLEFFAMLLDAGGGGGGAFCGFLVLVGARKATSPLMLPGTPSDSFSQSPPESYKTQEPTVSDNQGSGG